MRLLLGQQPSRYSDPPPPPHNSSPVNWPHSSPRQGEGDGPIQCDEGTRLPDMVPEGGGGLITTFFHSENTVNYINTCFLVRIQNYIIVPSEANIFTNYR